MQRARTALLLPFWWSWLVCAVGCAGADHAKDTDTLDRDFVSDQTSTCISGHPAAEPFDVGDVTVSSPAPMSGGSLPGAAAPAMASTLASFVAECQAASGTGCGEAFISREAARCIAQIESFEPGLEPWTIALAYHHSYHRVVWGIENLLVNNGAADYSGKSLTVDAVDGRVLGRTGWSAQ